MSETAITIALLIPSSIAIFMAGLSIGRTTERRKAAPIIVDLVEKIATMEADNGDQRATAFLQVMKEIRKDQSND